MKKKFIIPMLIAGFLSTSTTTLAYETKKGDTMGKIAEEHGLTLNELTQLNPSINNINLIYVGQTINTNKDKVHTITKTDNYELDLLARLVRAEALNQPFAGKVAVASVVLNRVYSSNFPNSISGVIYESGQFSPVSNGSINKPADIESIKAVQEALINRNTDALYFYNANTASSRWLDSRPTVTVIGDHTFKK